MSREAHIPIGLWMCAAILAHMAGGGGAVEVAKVYEERADVRAFIRGVRAGLRPADTTFELLTDATEATPPSQASAPPDRPAEPSDEPPDPEAPEEPAKIAEPAAPKKEKKVEDLEPLEPKPEEPKPEEKKAEVEAATEPVKVVPAEPPPRDNRIAVRQHVDKDQKDNPTASRIADDAHHTDAETVARIRSKDQDSADPTPGSHAGPRGEVGDSDEEKSGHSEDKEGDPARAPGESKEAAQSPEHHDPSPRGPESRAPAPAKASPPRPAAAARAPALSPPAPPPAPGGAGPAAPEVHDHDHGHFSIDPANPGGDGRSRSAGRRQATAPFHNPIDVRSMGLGAQAEPGRVNPNVTLPQVAAAVGDKQLKAERAADGAARRSKHRGSWETNKFERWRAAIENYEPSVKLGNQTSLNAARVPFATYINAIHNRLHPIFAEEFLASLDNLPGAHSLNQNLVTHIEIVLSKDEGRILRMGVTRASGVTAFDIVALNSVQRASPYGKAPEAIVSPDGNVYLHWEFHRDPFDACTTRNARPFMLKNAPSLAPPALAPRRVPTLKPSDERMTPPGPLLPLR